MANWRSWVMVSTAILAFSCSEEETTPPGPNSGPAPTISIDTPTEGAHVDAEIHEEGTDVEVEVDLEFTVRNFTLKEKGTCAGAANCGHVHVRVDGDKCNDTDEMGEKEPYNEEIWASPGHADLAYCEGVTIGADGIKGTDGPHAIELQLFNDDETPVMAAGKTVTDSVNVTSTVEAHDAGSDAGAGGSSGAAGAGGSSGTGGSSGAAGSGGTDAGGAGGAVGADAGSDAASD